MKVERLNYAMVKQLCQKENAAKKGTAINTGRLLQLIRSNSGRIPAKTVIEAFVQRSARNQRFGRHLRFYRPEAQQRMSEILQQLLEAPEMSEHSEDIEALLTTLCENSEHSRPIAVDPEGTDEEEAAAIDAAQQHHLLSPPLNEGGALSSIGSILGQGATIIYGPLTTSARVIKNGVLSAPSAIYSGVATAGSYLASGLVAVQETATTSLSSVVALGKTATDYATSTAQVAFHETCQILQYKTQEAKLHTAIKNLEQEQSALICASARIAAFLQRNLPVSRLTKNHYTLFQQFVTAHLSDKAFISPEETAPTYPTISVTSSIFLGLSSETTQQPDTDFVDRLPALRDQIIREAQESEEYRRLSAKITQAQSNLHQFQEENKPASAQKIEHIQQEVLSTTRTFAEATRSIAEATNSVIDRTQQTTDSISRTTAQTRAGLEAVGTGLETTITEASKIARTVRSGFDRLVEHSKP